MSQYDDLYDRFSSQIEAFANHREKIEKAKALEGKFNPEVVAKVVNDHNEKGMAVVTEIMTVLFEVESSVEELNSNREQINGGTTEQRNKLEELELNLMIEAISQEDFDAQSDAIKKSLADVDAKLVDIDADLERFNGALARWTELGTEAGVLQA
ncbi:MAG: hypothetical protein EP330_30905 [Deltaproteobacteria bacterium]|nr:MAG: hypothetical protein EP330_30905 [Deltaproteobacteria bacterium]